jgi:isoleucyl-tRNA synthetase
MTNTNDNVDFYKQSVFLPKTEFPMRGDLPKREPQILQNWQDMDLYQKLRDTSAGLPKFILHDGPPYANGHIHVGHALNKILKDVVVKYFHGMGYDTPYVPGWDCHGLPIEWKIEEKYRAAGKDKDEVSIVDFRRECREFAKHWVNVQSTDFQRLGVIGDFKNPYLTMNLKSEGTIAREIHKFVMNEQLYKGVKPVLWSVVEKTALAEAEVEYKEHKSITIWIKFPIIKSSDADLIGASVVIWTTTPWTMPSNRAVSYGKEVAYGLYEIVSVAEGSKAIIGDKILLAQSLAEATKASAKIEELKFIKTVSTDAFDGALAHHPLRGKGYEFDVPMLAGDFVTEDAGTGFVHMAPSHGADDYALCRVHGIEVPDNVTDDGRMRPQVPLFAGLSIYNEKGEAGDVNFAVLKEMEAVGALLAKGSVRHEYPHSWRSKSPLIFRTTPQWFIAMDGSGNIREKALSAIRETKWLPAKGETRISAMIASRPDWCISRQRTWGVPIAIFMHKETGAVLKDQAVNDRICEIFDAEGSDAWWIRNPQDFLGSDYSANDYQQIFDIVDVWFESGATHAFVLEDRPELQSPADLYLEGSDQHRGWFHSSLLESVGSRGRAPYKTVLTHGFVLDEKGYKMSKSLGNVVDPLELMDVHGADIIRLWALLADYSEDIRIGKDSLKVTADLYRRLRNTFRYLLGALDGFTKDEMVPAEQYKDMPELEQLALHQLSEMDAKIRKHIENYEFGRLVHLLHNFCNNELSAFYFDIRKDRLYCDRPDSFERRATRTVMFQIFECLVTWMAPVLAFTAEDAWTHRPAASENVASVHLRTFPQIPASWNQPALAAKWENVRDVRSVVLGALEPKRADKTIGSSLEAAPVIYVADTSLFDGIDLAEICITSQAFLKQGDAPSDAFKLADVANVAVVFEKAEGNKCQRCWKILPEVGSDPEYPDLSLRDADAVRFYVKQSKAA